MKQISYRGKFIVFEGPDFAGKGEQTVRTFHYLYYRSKSNEFVITREPTMNTPEGKEIRQLLKSLKNPYDAAERLFYLYVEDRKKHLASTILPNLSNGLTVLSDRYKYSTVAYQGAQGIPIDRIVDAHKDLLVPDLTIILTLPIGEWEKRLAQSKDHDEVFDEPRKEFTAKLLENYSRMNEFFPKENITTVSAYWLTKDEIHEKIVAELEKLFSR